MSSTGASTATAALLALAGLAALHGAAVARAAPGIDVMTRNLYVGADVVPLLTTPPNRIPAETAKALQRVRESDPPGRMMAVAREIAIVRPAIVGIQEAAVFQTIVRRAGIGRPAVTTAYDFRRLLLDALAAQGTPYTVVTQANNTSATLPSGGNTALKVTDHDLLLARAGPQGAGVRFANARSRRFTTRFAAGPFPVVRSYNMADFTVGGRSFRVVNTHLEYVSSRLRALQAAELLRGPLKRRTPALRHVLIGDINTDARARGANPYALFSAAGFADAWMQANPRSAGLTCCFGPLLTDPGASAFSERIDVVLTRGASGRARTARLVGTDPANRTATGRWPSDHAGLVARIDP